MRLIDKILLWEDRTKKWIETNRFSWSVILFFMGVALGVGGNIALGGSFNQGVIMGSAYALILIACEFTMGGKGLE